MGVGVGGGGWAVWGIFKVKEPHLVKIPVAAALHMTVHEVGNELFKRSIPPKYPLCSDAMMEERAHYVLRIPYCMDYLGEGGEFAEGAFVSYSKLASFFGDFTRVLDPQIENFFLKARKCV